MKLKGTNKKRDRKKKRTMKGSVKDKQAKLPERVECRDMNEDEWKAEVSDTDNLNIPEN